MPCVPGLCPVARRCRHREFVEDYRAERQRQEEAVDEASSGYVTERAELVEAEPLIDFRTYLVMTAGR